MYAQELQNEIHETIIVHIFVTRRMYSHGYRKVATHFLLMIFKTMIFKTHKNFQNAIYYACSVSYDSCQNQSNQNIQGEIKNISCVKRKYLRYLLNIARLG